MIELPKEHSDPLVIGVGHHRVCYIHPQDPAKCIKVIYNFTDHADVEVKRECAYYRRLQKYLTDWRGIPRFYGEVQTNLGTGYVYDRTVDFDGKPSQTMLQRYQGFKESPELYDEMLHLIEVLERYLTDNHIVTMNIKPMNVLCHRVSSTEVFPVICDNLGTSAFFPIAEYCPWFARKKLKRQFERMRSKLPSRYDDGVKWF